MTEREDSVCILSNVIQDAKVDLPDNLHGSDRAESRSMADILNIQSVYICTYIYIYSFKNIAVLKISVKSLYCIFEPMIINW